MGAVVGGAPTVNMLDDDGAEVRITNDAVALAKEGIHLVVVDLPFTGEMAVPIVPMGVINGRLLAQAGS